eukprot:GABU01004158.1.p1 GENE.GABU01004158.1~~GABU01004158.1.p1  ORF type:complete len:130 (+),score=5.68 GABU01004158.1:216-605(+)
MIWSRSVPMGRQGRCGMQNSLSNFGRYTLPLNRGHNWPNILKDELFPQPFGPEMMQFTPLLIVKFMFSTRTSPLGETIGTDSNLMYSASTNLPRDNRLRLLPLASVDLATLARTQLPSAGPATLGRSHG